MKKIFVSKTGTVKSISEALLLVNNEPAEILIDDGIYFEKISVLKDNITLKGKSKENTIISYNDFSKKLHNDLYEYNTFRTYTLQVLGKNVTIENLTIENSAGSGKKFGQAVALQSIGDMTYINNCIIKGYQDTVFIGPLPLDLIDRYQGFLEPEILNINYQTRHVFNNCYIEGDVDFIFGSGNAIFNNCELFGLTDGKLSNGYYFAPSTEKNSKYGITVINSKLTGKSDREWFYIGRPWREYGMLTLINCELDDIIYEEKYNKWENTNRDKTCRFNEFKSYGKSANKKGVTWVNNNIDLNEYKIEKIMDGWNPIK